MADAAIDLDAIVLAVEIIDDADLAVGHFPGIAIAEIPASAVVADDEFGPPRLAFVLADPAAHSRRHEAIAIDHDEAAVLLHHEASRRAEIVHARQEIPGLAAIVAGKRSEAPTSELQSLMRITTAVFFLQKKTK